MNPKRSEHKWQLAQNKLERIAKLLRKRLTESDHELSEDMKLLDGVVVLLQIKSDKDPKGEPNGRIRIVFGDPGHSQTIPIRDDETNIDGVVQALTLFLNTKKKSIDLEQKKQQYLQQNTELIRGLADKLHGSYELILDTPKCMIQNRVALYVDNHCITMVISKLDEKQVLSIIRSLEEHLVLAKNGEHS
jgi:hypothetical protein